MSDHSTDPLVFALLVKKAGLNSIAAFELCLNEIGADRGPSHIAARTCDKHLHRALGDAATILLVKKMFRGWQAEPRAEKSCRALEELLQDFKRLKSEVVKHLIPNTANPSRSPRDGLASDLGPHRLNSLITTLLACKEWIQKHPSPKMPPK